MLKAALGRLLYWRRTEGGFLVDKVVWFCVFPALQPTRPREDIYRLCLVSDQVLAYPSIRWSSREYFGELAVTRYHWLMLIAPRRPPLSLHQQASPAAIIILKIIPEKWSHHWIIQPSSLVRTLCDLWHHCSWLHFSRCVRQKSLGQELKSQNA